MEPQQQKSWFHYFNFICCHEFDKQGKGNYLELIDPFIQFQTARHRVTKWPGLEGTSRITNLQPHHHMQGHQLPRLILDQHDKPHIPKSPIYFFFPLRYILLYYNPTREMYVLFSLLITRAAHPNCLELRLRSTIVSWDISYHELVPFQVQAAEQLQQFWKKTSVSFVSFCQ